MQQWVTGRTEALEIFMPNSSEIILLCNACVRRTLFAEAHVYCCCTVLSHPHATATGGRTSTGSDHTICSGVDALDSHPAGLAAEVVNSKRSTQRSATRCVAKEAGASRGSENMKCVSVRSEVTSTCSSQTCTPHPPPLCMSEPQIRITCAREQAGSLLLRYRVCRAHDLS